MALCGATETSRKTPTARNQNAVLTAVTFQYRLVKGPGMNVPVVHAMNDHAPSEVPTHANTFALLGRLETRIPTLPAIIEKPSISQETKPSRITTTWFAASWYKPVSGVSQRTMEGATRVRQSRRRRKSRPIPWRRESWRCSPFESSHCGRSKTSLHRAAT